MIPANKVSVAAVVVTYNRRVLLEQCLRTIRAQTRPLDQVVVINNGSTDGTEEWLETQNDLFIVHQANEGGAGGFYTGIKTAYEMEYDWIWCMDDDGIPEPDCLANLLAVGERGFHYVAPNLLDEKGVGHFERRFKMTRTDVVSFCGGPFNAILLSRDLVRAVGYPMRNFFIWGDEVEYCNRIVESGFPVVTVRNAIHHHKRTTIDYRTCKRGFYLVRNGIYCYRLFQGVFRSKTVYLMGRSFETMRFIFGSLVHFNFRQVGAALYGFMHGWVDPLYESQEQCSWWGLEKATRNDLNAEYNAESG